MNTQHAGLSEALASNASPNGASRPPRRGCGCVRPPRRNRMGGPRLVAAGPMAKRRHRPARQSPTQLIDGR